MSEPRLLIGDIGGTNARFALASPDGPGYERVLALQCADFETAELAIAAYLEQTGTTQPAVICLAAAGPDGPLDSIRRGLEIWWHTMFTAIIISGVPAFLHFALNFVVRDRQALVTRFSPETVGTVLAVDLTLYLFTNFILVVAVTLTFLARRGEV